MPKRILTRSKVNLLFHLYDQGVPTAEIARRLGCSRHTVTSRVSRAGAANRSVSYLSKLPKDLHTQYNTLIRKKHLTSLEAYNLLMGIPDDE